MGRSLTRRLLEHTLLDARWHILVFVLLFIGLVQWLTVNHFLTVS